MPGALTAIPSAIVSPAQGRFARANLAYMLG